MTPRQNLRAAPDAGAMMMASVIKIDSTSEKKYEESVNSAKVVM
jgi:hypothetical protein